MWYICQDLCLARTTDPAVECLLMSLQQNQLPIKDIVVLDDDENEFYFEILF
jgi:hypothetical protein